MAECILKMKDLSKTYKNNQALSHVSFEIEPGKIYGLIGRNGAGKTTLMRMITGLSVPTSGEMELFGCIKKNEIESQRKRMGSLIEYPGLIASLTAKQNLHYHRILRGIPNEETEDELLKLVGLADTGKKKTKDFSLGMKQRLGIAIALLGNPEFIILDEPINGLDPVGVVEIRKLLTGLCEEKQLTILISSHNLPELYQLATNYIIIHKGKIVEELTLQQLDEKCRHYIQIECDNPEKLTEIIEQDLKTENYLVMPDKKIRLFDFVDNKEIVTKTITRKGISIYEFKVQGESLENYFISLVGGETND